MPRGCWCLGGGHVSQELVPLLSRVGFRCVVFDDRPEFTTEALFPDAVARITGDFENIAASLEIGPGDYVTVMTRGHSYDLEVQRQVLARPSAYVGVIGSRSKIAAVNKRLLEAGVPQREIDRVHTPIGLPIKAQTPAEIAVSIAAEMILIRAGLAEASAKPG
ncbi:XdhC family protein [Ruminococcaceae bacterium OttesenSCG-928-D13]|nr:XdhC family protein [Ruminococcaceae bacterium OttesenSCG-928-D13]